MGKKKAPELPPEIPPDVMEYFRKTGAAGGKRSLVTMTPEERTARAKKAAEARYKKKKKP